MAISSIPDMDLTGMRYATRTTDLKYSARFKEMRAWQMVSFSEKFSVAHCWDQAAKVNLTGGDTQLEEQSFGNTGKLMPIPK